MSNHFYLDWATTAVSLANTILLLWLGMTVLLNADRRTWGIWMAGGSLLLGGGFFVSHTAILAMELTHLSQGLRFWWYLGLFPAVALPLAWYIVMLWYTGYWNREHNRLYRRQRRWLPALLTLGAAGLVAVLAYANPFPEQFSLLPLRFAITIIGGTPLLVAGYALFLLLCVGLALDALLRPGPTERIMGDVARRRARGWLVAASLLLLIVSLVVIGALLWILLNARFNGTYIVTEDTLVTLARFDLLVSTLIGMATVVLGQAIVAYEIFTGKTLPRSGLRRQWQQAVLLAVGYGVLVGWTLTSELRPVYSVLIATLLMVTFVALLSWRSYVERERYIEHLRPFVSSQRLYEHLLAPGRRSTPELDAQFPFHTLCRDILETQLAYLVPLGTLAPLAGPPLAYPPTSTAELPPLNQLASRFTSPSTLWVALEPEQYSGASWGIPLWSERGLIGLLLLGQKRDGSVYTQEEMEIARASGERLVDVQASAEMTRRLLDLQRQRLVESQVADRRTRRILHDEVLPQLHAALLATASNTAEGDSAEVQELLSDVHRQISDLLHDIPPAITPEVARLGAVEALRRTVQGEFAGAFEEIMWQVPAAMAQQARRLPALTGEVLFYAAREAVRNAAHHGRGADDGQPLRLKISGGWEGQQLQLTIEDNGVGVEAAHGGVENGRGLALHSTMMAVVGGTLSLESAPGAYTRVRLSLGQNND